MFSATRGLHWLGGARDRDEMIENVDRGSWQHRYLQDLCTNLRLYPNSAMAQFHLPSCTQADPARFIWVKVRFFLFGMWCYIRSVVDMVPLSVVMCLWCDYTLWLCYGYVLWSCSALVVWESVLRDASSKMSMFLLGYFLAHVPYTHPHMIVMIISQLSQHLNSIKSTHNMLPYINLREELQLEKSRFRDVRRLIEVCRLKGS